MSTSPLPLPTSSSTCVVGIVGGIASGKSTVSRILAELGAHVIDADQFAREAMERPETIQAVRDRFGDQVIEEGRLSRSALAALVFGNSSEAKARRQELERIIHPQVRRRTEEILAAYECENTSQPETAPTNKSVSDTSRSDMISTGPADLHNAPVIVLDIPLLFESGWDARCDRILFVDTPSEVRKQRALERGWTVEQWSEREASQVDVDEKRRLATDHVQNDGCLANLRRQLEPLMTAWARSVTRQH
ncbi:MAG: dephospho-CoA kinase [Pirellulales bacterium]